MVVFRAAHRVVFRVAMTGFLIAAFVLGVAMIVRPGAASSVRALAGRTVGSDPLASVAGLRLTTIAPVRHIVLMGRPARVALHRSPLPPGRIADLAADHLAAGPGRIPFRIDRGGMAMAGTVDMEAAEPAGGLPTATVVTAFRDPDGTSSVVIVTRLEPSDGKPGNPVADPAEVAQRDAVIYGDLRADARTGLIVRRGERGGSGADARRRSAPMDATSHAIVERRAIGVGGEILEIIGLAGPIPGRGKP